MVNETKVHEALPDNRPIRLGIISFNVNFKDVLHNNPLTVCVLEGYLRHVLPAGTIEFNHFDLTYCQPENVFRNGPYDFLGFDVNRECIDDFLDFVRRYPVTGIAKKLFATGSYLCCLKGAASALRRAAAECVPEMLLI